MIQKIWLQPLGKFFFGGESSFKENNQENRRRTYILHSRYYPQQTSALGLIRNQLLLQNGLLQDNSKQIKDNDSAKRLIGNNGFVIGKEDNYGVVSGISPVYLADSAGTAIPPAPLDDVNSNPLIFDFEFGRPLLRNFNPKDGLEQMLYINNSSASNFPLQKVFTQYEQVGINKSARPDGIEVVEEDTEAGYYYQTFLSKSDESPVSGFVFYVNIDISNNIKLEDAIVEFGGERSTFYMKVEEVKSPDFPTPNVVYKYSKISQGHVVKRLLCLSPAYVKEMNRLRELSHLIVSQTISFRFFKTNIDNTRHHQIIQNNNNSLQESGLYHLLDRGSVVYFTPAQETELLELFSNTSFQNIGYNKYILL